MDAVFKLSSYAEAESLIKARLKVRPIASGNSCQIKVLNLDKVEQNRLKLFEGTVYKDKEWGTMFAVSDPDISGHQKVRIIT